MSPLWPDHQRQTIFDIIQPGEKICFVVSDYTRKTAVNTFLPVVIDGLIEKKCRPADFHVIVASGIHRPCTEAEIHNILGEKTANMLQGRIFLHDPDDTANLVKAGKTPLGHDVYINRHAMEADRLVLTGSAIYHYHAGFGGGRKSIVPGLASRETIAYNHSLTLHPEKDEIRPMVEPGILDGNPVSEEMFNSAILRRPDIIINSVLDPKGNIIGLFSGDVDTAHRAACQLVEKIYRTDISEYADFVIADAGTAPNWIQSHKSLFNASRCVKPDQRVKRIILNAKCPEGIGNERFRYWMKKGAAATIINELRKSPEILGQTALSTTMRGAQTILVTDLSEKDIRDLGIETAKDIPTAVERVLQDIKEKTNIINPSYYLMPDAGYTVPFPSDQPPRRRVGADRENRK